jgi:hypothetical protein
MRRFQVTSEHAKRADYSAGWQRSGKVPNNSVLEYVPVPVQAWRTNDELLGAEANKSGQLCLLFQRKEVR